MRALLNENSVDNFDARILYKEIIKLFDEYNINKLAIQNIAQESLTRNQEIYMASFQRGKSDPTIKAAIKSEKFLDYVNNFEKKIEFLKSQFTDDEKIVFHYSLEERELDKEIMERVCKTNHKYYQIKKSCYLKIALCFGIIKPKETKAVNMVTQCE